MAQSLRASISKELDRVEAFYSTDMELREKELGTTTASKVSLRSRVKKQRPEQVRSTFFEKEHRHTWHGM